ncbi:hypothetical protein Peur_002192 [Populus x canadensis]
MSAAPFHKNKTRTTSALQILDSVRRQSMSSRVLCSPVNSFLLSVDRQSTSLLYINSLMDGHFYSRETLVFYLKLACDCPALPSQFGKRLNLKLPSNHLPM